MKSTTSYTYKDIWLIAYPILISLLMEQMIGITDTAFLGHVGEIELGASAIAGVYYLAIFMIGFGFTIGSQILIARRNGEGNYRAIGNIFYQGIYFLMLMSLVIFTLSQLFSEQILGVLVASDRIVGAATDYIRWRVYGFFFSFIGAMFRAFFVGTTVCLHRSSAGCPYLAVSLTGAAHLYRHSRPDSCQHPYPLGTVFHLPGQYSRIHLFPVGIRNRQYPCSLHPRNDRTGTVHCLHPDCHYRTKGRRRRMLDRRTPVCHMHRRSQLPVYSEIQLAA